MRELALSDDILLRVEKPGRYIGNELNSIKKDPSKVDIRVAMCFPDVYEIGMSHLGIQILYEQFNRREDTYCERVYSPWMDLHKIMKEENIPLFALETQDPVKDFDFMGVTLMYEMCYTNLLQLIDLAGMELRACDRDEDDPIVMVGGACTYNPEPIAPFVDFVYIGEGEVSYDEIYDTYVSMKKDGSYTKMDYLKRISSIPGVYVPALYDVEYKEDGTISSFKPNCPEAPETVKRVIITDFEHGAYPTKPLVPFVRTTFDRVVLEIQRGCIRGCRFCQAGMTYRPNREKSCDLLLEQAIEMLDSTGQDEMSLSSLSSSDYHDLPRLVNELIDECSKRHVNISLPSLRIDAFSLDVMSKVQDIKKSSLTFAPEAGSQRLRNVINKGLTKENIVNGSNSAFEGGWNKVKLYFMLGLPTETVEDMKAIPELANEIAANYYDLIPKDKRTGKVNITISTSFFVPKPFTPFQWCRMYTKEDYLNRAHIVNDTLQEQLNKKSIRYAYHEADVTVLEGIFARGNRKIADAIEYAYKNGQLYDAWSEFYDDDAWYRAFDACGIDTDFFYLREIPLDEILPWDFIDIGITKKFFLKEWENALNEQVTPNCKMKCSGCGAARFGGGICHEGKN